MPITRLYQALPLKSQLIFRLSEEAGHHIARVLRAKPGEKLVLFNGQGGEYEAVIQKLDKKGVEVQVLAFRAHEVESSLDIHLVQGIARGEKMDFIVQKAVELGVNKITPLITERCNVKWDSQREEKRVQHWQSVAVSACEQSGRNRVPEISSPLSLTEGLKGIKGDLSLVLSPHVQDKLPAEPLPFKAKLVLLIGPEGGLSTQEVERALQLGFKPWHLGPRTLRTETAAIAAVAALQYAYGDFK